MAKRVWISSGELNTAEAKAEALAEVKEFLDTYDGTASIEASVVKEDTKD